MLPSLLFKNYERQSRNEIIQPPFYVFFFQHTLAFRRKEIILFFSSKIFFWKAFILSFIWFNWFKCWKNETLSCNFLSMHIEKKNYFWQEELSIWISAEVNCLVFVIEYNSYNSIWAAATNKLIKTVSWDPGVHQCVTSTNVSAQSLNHRMCLCTFTQSH